MTKHFSVIIILTFSACLLYAQNNWVWQNPSPQGNAIADMQFLNQTTGYCVAPAGIVMKTTNSGLNWAVMKTALPSDLNALSIVNQNVIYTAGGNEVYKSADGGLTWSLKEVSNSGYICSVCFINESTGFLGGDQVIMKSTNSGNNWVAMSSYPNGSVNVLYFINSTTGFAAGGGFSILRTTNGGSSWTNVQQESGVGAYLSMIFVNANTGYTVGSGGKIRKTTNGGTNWFSLTSGTTAELYSITNYDTLNITAAGSNGTIIRTTNGGTSWSLYQADITSVYGIVYLNSGTLLVAGSMGMIQKSTNSGVNWSYVSSGMYYEMYNSCFVNSQTGFITSSQGILKTSNSGNTWISILPGEFRSVSFAGNLTGYAAGVGGAIYKTTDAGETWTAQVSGASSTLFAIQFVDQLTGFAGGPPNSILRTTTGGTIWEKIYLTSNGQINDICFINSNTGFMVTGGGKILKTTDSGFNWNTVFSSTSGNIYEIDFGDANNGYAAAGTKLLVTTNGGNTWSQKTPSTSPLTMEDIACVDFTNANTGYIAGLVMLSGSSEAAVCKTTNGGLNWIMEFPGVKLNIYSIYTVSADTCFITSSNGGIIRGAEGLTPVIPASNNIPRDYALFQNYPNPFNPSTNIKYLIAESGEVRLSVYDVLGREIAVLINEKQNPGTYEYRWNASDYPSGIYFYKLVTSDFTETRKMILVK